jgi:hypothetical protein
MVRVVVKTLSNVFGAFPGARRKTNRVCIFIEDNRYLGAPEPVAMAKLTTKVEPSSES